MSCGIQSSPILIWWIIIIYDCVCMYFSINIDVFTFWSNKIKFYTNWSFTLIIKHVYTCIVYALLCDTYFQLFSQWHSNCISIFHVVSEVIFRGCVSSSSLVFFLLRSFCIIYNWWIYSSEWIKHWYNYKKFWKICIICFISNIMGKSNFSENMKDTEKC